MRPLGSHGGRSAAPSARSGLLGIVRTYLALVVAAAHLTGWTHATAGYAVFAFYMISGYLMTLTLHAHYGFKAEGFRRYVSNRFLRIYPPYYVAALIALCIVAVFGPAATAFHRNFRWPADAWELFQNLTNFYWTPDNASHLVPPSWAIAVEFLFYVLLGLGLARNRLTALACFAVGAGYHVLALRYGWDRYYSPLAAALPYGMGVLACFIVRDMQWTAPPAVAAWTLAAYLAPVPLFRFLGASEFHVPLYVSVGAFFAVLLILARADPGRLRRLDAWCGGLAYPIYLLHYQAGFALATTVGLSRGWALFFTTLPLLVAAASLVDQLNLRTVERLRSAIRGKRDTGARTPLLEPVHA